MSLWLFDILKVFWRCCQFVFRLNKVWWLFSGCFLGYLHFFVIKFYKKWKTTKLSKRLKIWIFFEKTLTKGFLTSAKMINKILCLVLAVLNLVPRTFLPNFVLFCLILLNFYRFCVYFYHNTFQNYIVLHTLIKHHILKSQIYTLALIPIIVDTLKNNVSTHALHC